MITFLERFTERKELMKLNYKHSVYAKMLFLFISTKGINSAILIYCMLRLVPIYKYHAYIKELIKPLKQIGILSTAHREPMGVFLGTVPI